MSIKLLKELFTQLAPAGYACTSAAQSYDRSTGREMQVIKFSGLTPNGDQFELTSDPMRPDTPLQIAVEQVVAMIPQPTAPSQPSAAPPTDMVGLDLTKLDDAQLAVLSSRVASEAKSRVHPADGAKLAAVIDGAGQSAPDIKTEEPTP